MIGKIAGLDLGSGLIMGDLSWRVRAVSDVEFVDG